jgi:hypothetical protein
MADPALIKEVERLRGLHLFSHDDSGPGSGCVIFQWDLEIDTE